MILFFINTVFTVHKGNCLDSIISARGSYRVTDSFFEDFPFAKNRLGKGTNNMIASNFFENLPEVWVDKHEKSNDYYGFLCRLNGERKYKYIKREYIVKNDYLDKYNILVPEANGTGAIGEALSTPLISTPLIGATDTFISIGKFDKKTEAEACLKYVKSKFARTMLGVLKVTQHNPAKTWKYVPLQDFTSNSDIDWSQSVADIDRQLYAKYGLDDKEIEFIETHVKEME